MVLLSTDISLIEISRNFLKDWHIFIKPFCTVEIKLNSCFLLDFIRFTSASFITLQSYLVRDAVSSISCRKTSLDS